MQKHNNWTDASIVYVHEDIKIVIHVLKFRHANPDSKSFGAIKHSVLFSSAIDLKY